MIWSALSNQHNFTQDWVLNLLLDLLSTEKLKGYWIICLYSESETKENLLFYLTIMRERKIICLNGLDLEIRSKSHQSKNFWIFVILMSLIFPILQTEIFFIMRLEKSKMNQNRDKSCGQINNIIQIWLSLVVILAKNYL